MTWNDQELGSIYSLRLNGGDPVKLSMQKGIYRNPAYSHDGKLITYRKESGNNEQGRTFSKKTGIYIMNTDGSDPKFIIKEGDYPTFNLSGDRIIYQKGGIYFGALTKELKSVDLNGKEERSHFSSKLANRLVPSKDNKFVAFIHLHKLFVAPFVMNGSEINVDQNTKSFKVESLSKNAGINLHWSANNKKIHWTLGDEYFSKSIVNNTTNPFAKTNLTTDKATGIKINLKEKSDIPEGRIAFKNARIITMDGNEVIEDGTIIINKNKIEKEKKEIEIVLLNASQRYILFKEEFPTLEQLISQFHIASYLGISATQLSRIRRQFLTK